MNNRNYIITISFIVLLVLILLSPYILGYKQGPNVTDIEDPNTYVHQKITKEAQKTWPLIPYEIKLRLNNSLSADPNDEVSFESRRTCLEVENTNYDFGDDVITGSGEEDNVRSTCVSNFGNHFWQPDTVSGGFYNDGLNTPLPQNSSYRKALDYWRTEVIPSYLRGDINRSYYFLGRVAHLLEDAAQPSHVHNDPHGGHWYLGGDSILEEYTGDNLLALQNTYNWKGENFRQYNYENLIPNFNWTRIDSTLVPDRQNVELFRLFWYTAQKTQYWASDDEDGNTIYRDLDGNTYNWNCSSNTSLNLWSDDGYITCNSFISDNSNLNANTVEREANATIPHAMKSVAGLYRLFDDAVRIDWPTENHDYRRTGFTLLKGDLTNKEIVRNQLDFFLDAVNDNIQQVVKPSVADIDGDGKMDQVIIVHKPVMGNFSLMFGTTIKPTPKRKWTNPIQVRGGEDGSIYRPPTLADIDNDGKKEIITGNRNGTIYAYDFDGGQPAIKWKYHLEPRFDGTNFRVKFNGGSAVVDIDLDGQQEVIVVDLLDGDDEWPGKVYVLNGNTGANETSYTIGNGGSYGSVSIANLDSDDNPEIVVPSQYGIIVLDYSPSTGKLNKLCNNTHAYLWDSAVIYDVDKDNDYEIVYVTANTPCAAGSTCENKLHVVNPLTCNEVPNFPISFTDIPRGAPTIANLDSDSNMEIVITMEKTLPDGLGSVRAFDAVTGTQQWVYDASSTLHPGAISPNVADIDNDGNYNIILGENKGSTVYFLKNDGNLLFDYKVIGFMDNGIAIADLDNDGMAEIAFKRAASPETVFVSVSNINTPPEIIKISNVTAIAGNLINISQLVSTSDAEANNVQLLYSSPFSSSGQWQTTINDTGNYSILVEASDGNLSTTQFIDVIVFNETTKLQNQFTDGLTNKLLNFTQPGNLTVNIRLPKNATVIYSKLKVTGLAP